VAAGLFSFSYDTAFSNICNIHKHYQNWINSANTRLHLDVEPPGARVQAPLILNTNPCIGTLDPEINGACMDGDQGCLAVMLL